MTMAADGRRKMIHVIDDWYIDVDEYQYIVKKDLHRVRTDKKTGKAVDEYRAVSYHSSLSKALKSLGRKIILDDLQGQSMELEEACTRIKAQADRWETIMKNIMEACGI